MKTYNNPSQKSWSALLQRPVIENKNLFNTVGSIIENIRNSGDRALKSYTKQFDGLELDEIAVPAEEINASRLLVNKELQNAIATSMRNIELFHSSQLVSTPIVETTAGVKCWQKSVAIEKVGLYIPGGTAPLLSTALMLGVPAKLAGCKEVILCSPPGPDGKLSPAILYIASLLGIDKVFRIGGAQAIAAMAYGTETVPSVDKIFGPGNQYVTAAKQMVSLDATAIDLPAGPSELAVIADESADASFVASDLLSQAEHGVDSQVILVTNSGDFLEKVKVELANQLATLPRRDIAQKSLENSKLILMDSMEQIIEMINMYAPEHLIIACSGYTEIAGRIINAGSVFLGNYTPESAGDYASGTNHTLPTNGWARSYNGLNMDSFVKKITFQEISREGLGKIGSAIMELADAESLEAHKNAVKIRLV